MSGKNPTRYLGPPDHLWLLIDTSNGQDGAKYYTWYFHTREAARQHKMKQNSDPSKAWLEGPFKYKLVK